MKLDSYFFFNALTLLDVLISFNMCYTWIKNMLPHILLLLLFSCVLTGLLHESKITCHTFYIFMLQPVLFEHHKQVLNYYAFLFTYGLFFFQLAVYLIFTSYATGNSFLMLSFQRLTCQLHFHFKWSLLNLQT